MPVVQPQVPAGGVPVVVATPAEERAHPVKVAVPVEERPHPVKVAVPVEERPYPVVPALPVDMHPVVQARPRGCPKGYKLLHPGTPAQRCVKHGTVVARAVETAVKKVGRAARAEDRPVKIGQAVSEAVTSVKVASGAPATAAKVAGVKAGRAVQRAVAGRPVPPGGVAPIVAAAVGAAIKDKVKPAKARVVEGKMILACPSGYKKVKLTTGAVKCVRSAKEIKKGYAVAGAKVRSHPVVQAVARDVGPRRGVAVPVGPKVGRAVPA
jgi:hypothetical protein